MRRGGVFDPRMVKHVQPSLNTTLKAKAKIYRPGARPEWEPGMGNKEPTDTQIWAGDVRVQPNIDWRARVRDFGGEYDATMAVRFDLPMHKNEYGATFDTDGKVIHFADDPVFAFGDRIVVTELAGPGQRTLLDKVYTVRNALPSTTMFQHNLLCDVGTSFHG
jgi:hypothetical protein